MTSFCQVGIEVAKSISHRELSWLVMDLAFHSRDAWFWLCLFEIGSYLWVPLEFQTTNPIQQLTIGWLWPVWYIDLFLGSSIDHLLTKSHTKVCMHNTLVGMSSCKLCQVPTSILFFFIQRDVETTFAVPGISLGHGTDLILILTHLKAGTPSTEIDDLSTTLYKKESKRSFAG